MQYVSTRGGDRATFSRALMQGLAADGGLFVPERLPDVSSLMQQWRGMKYADLAHAFLSLFITDIPADELRGCVERAYGSFAKGNKPVPIVPLRKGSLYVMELFHGPTLAFKDFALQLLGQLYGRQVSNTGQRVNILGATSGDTGSAAIYGMLPLPDTHSFILYPDGRIADLQERQIACTGSPRVHALAIQGSFDDAQRIVKQILGDAEFTAAHSLTAVNSINIARILAQCIYYMYAALKLNASESRPVEFLVPTGNFGNVLAGMMLGRMGAPGLRFCIATNHNSVVSDFFTTGKYITGEVVPSCAPSMDIQQASNFERWLWWHFKGDGKRVGSTMERLRRNGSLYIKDIRTDNVRADLCDDADIKRTIENIHRETGYIADPHTACAFAALSNVRSKLRSVVVATAHPAKFPDTIAAATGHTPAHPSLERLKDVKREKTLLPAEVDAVKREISKHINVD